MYMKTAKPLLQLLKYIERFPKLFNFWNIRHCLGNNNILKSYGIEENTIMLIDIAYPLLQLLYHRTILQYKL